MKTFIVICIALLMCGCRAGTIAAIGTGISQGLSGEPPPPPRPRPVSCTAVATGIYTRIDCD